MGRVVVVDSQQMFAGPHPRSRSNGVRRHRPDDEQLVARDALEAKRAAVLGRQLEGVDARLRVALQHLLELDQLKLVRVAGDAHAKDGAGRVRDVLHDLQ